MGGEAHRGRGGKRGGERGEGWGGGAHRGRGGQRGGVVGGIDAHPDLLLLVHMFMWIKVIVLLQHLLLWHYNSNSVLKVKQIYIVIYYIYI